MAICVIAAFIDFLLQLSYTLFVIYLYLFNIDYFLL